MTLNRRIVFQAFKYAVYAALAVNVWVFFAEEHLAAVVEFPGGVPFASLTEAYAATIDTAAWLVLLLMFELETFVLDDEQFTPRLTRTLHGIRFFSYVFIVIAFVGYVEQLVFVYDVAPAAGLVDLCALDGDGWVFAVDFEEYVAITAATCAELSEATAYLQFGQLPAVVDAAGLPHIQYLAWADVINAATWLLIVVILEIDVRLQERGRLEGAVLRISNAIKFLLYATLFVIAIYWTIDGDFVDSWDAYLWLVAFFFIEMNVLEWRHESLASQ
ncbi:MAG: hypothetical protein R3358_05615 [Woeseiaceae bacterium]|nr:hypothetical protein [Woeseiaceae bacterium]